MSTSILNPAVRSGPSEAAQPFPGRWRALPVLSGALLVVVMANTSLNVALQSLQRSLNASSDQLQWTLDAYPLAVASLLFVMGAVGDRLGRHRALWIGLGAFGTASGLTALANSPAEVMAGRAAMGVAGAVIMPATLGLVRALFPEHERPRALAVWSASTGLALALGPVLAGALLTTFSWTSIFWSTALLAAGLLAAALKLVPPSRAENPAPLDAPGMVLSALALAPLTFAVIEGPYDGWTSAPVIGGFAASAIAIGAFVLVEHRTERPLVDLGWFANRSFAMGALLTLGVFTVLVGLLYVLTLYLQVSLGNDPLQTGLETLPMGAALLICAGAGNALADRVGRTALSVGGFILAAVGGGLLLGISVSDRYSDVVLGIFLVAAGAGFVVPVVTDAVLANAPAEHGSVVGAVSDAAIELGAALGIAILGSILTASYRNQLPHHLVAQLPRSARNAVNDGLPAALQASQHLPARLRQPLLHAANSAFIHGLHSAFLAATALAAAAALLAFLLPTRDSTPPPRTEIGTESRQNPSARASAHA